MVSVTQPLFDVVAGHTLAILIARGPGNLTGVTPRAGRAHPALHPHPRLQGAGGARLGPRDQARRLSPAGPARRRHRAPLHAAWLRLERPLSGVRRHRHAAARPLVHLGRRGLRLRTGGVAIFDALHRRGTVSDAMLYAFDLLELDGEDLRALPQGDRKKWLVLARRRVGIVLSAHTAEEGTMIFQQACKMGLEGIVSKRLSAPYRSGPSRDWIKVKNPGATIRARE
jgi:ATP dependent DNA ligase domain